MKSFEKAVDDITLEDAEKIIEKKYVGGTYLKILNKEVNIRDGKYGPYVYYKEKRHEKPKFIRIPKKMNWESIDMTWVLENVGK